MPFNSLDAQRESCEAFILSQKHEGWTALPEMYDDGGLSGGTLERPALKRILADIEGHRIDTVVVYKVDRLTRSLGDFARIVEIFDKGKVSFVSVTQQFNTTTSMGRLTLNMLLSFAQFEREVTGERIRDKIAASKKKGMWMGGNVPLGYVVKDRKLLIDEAEARRVQDIYRRYVTLGSVRSLKEELERDGVVSKVRVDRYGRATGGKPLARGALYTMLRNRIYRGRIVHKDKHYPGAHEAIVDEALWDAVQRQLAANRIACATGTHGAEPSLLAGLIYDDSGQRMTPSHANKKGTRYRYYVSQALVDDVNRRQEVVELAADLAARWPDLEPTTKRQIFKRLVNRINLTQETLEIRIAPGRLLEILWEEDNPKTLEPALWDNELTVTFTVSAHLKRAGMETRLLIEGADGSARKSPDRSLLRLLSQAQRFHEMVLHNRGRTMTELAIEAGVGGSYFTRILRLSFLAPEVVKTILRDRHPLELTAKKLAGDTRLPIAWEEQRARFGIA